MLRGFKGIILLLALATQPLGAAEFSLNRDELLKLVEITAPKVNLFKEIWAHDPEAQIYAGTTRDFIYWILGHFPAHQSSSAQIEAIKKLKERDHIDISEFIHQSSDVDVISSNPDSLAEVLIQKWPVRRIEVIRSQSLIGTLFDEVHQGYMAIEKMRLKSQGQIYTPPAFGEPIQEILSGNLNVHFSSSHYFWRTRFAREGLNHPALLALRFLRNWILDQTKRNGIIEALPPDLFSRISFIFSEALQDQKFKTFLNHEKSRFWFNTLVRKCFNLNKDRISIINLMKDIGLWKLLEANDDKLESINLLSFYEVIDTEASSQWIIEQGLKPSDIISDFGDLNYLTVYHATESRHTYRLIISKGFLPSETGAVGHGLYVFPYHLKKEAHHWAFKRSRDEDLVFELSLDPQTRVLDITAGSKAHNLVLKIAHKMNLSLVDATEFVAGKVGAEIIKYGFGKDFAFCIRSSRIIQKTNGLHLSLTDFSEILRESKNLTPDNLSTWAKRVLGLGPAFSDLHNIISGIPYALRYQATAELIKTTYGLSLRDRLQYAADFLKWFDNASDHTHYDTVKSLIEFTFLEIFDRLASEPRSSDHLSNLRYDEALDAVNHISSDVALIIVEQAPIRDRIFSWLSSRWSDFENDQSFEFRNSNRVKPLIDIYGMSRLVHYSLAYQDFKSKIKEQAFKYGPLYLLISRIEPIHDLTNETLDWLYASGIENQIKFNQLIHLINEQIESSSATDSSSRWAPEVLHTLLEIGQKFLDQPQNKEKTEERIKTQICIFGIKTLMRVYISEVELNQFKESLEQSLLIKSNYLLATQLHSIIYQNMIVSKSITPNRLLYLIEASPTPKSFVVYLQTSLLGHINILSSEYQPALHKLMTRLSPALAVEIYAEILQFAIDQKSTPDLSHSIDNLTASLWRHLAESNALDEIASYQIEPSRLTYAHWAFGRSADLVNGLLRESKAFDQYHTSASNRNLDIEKSLAQFQEEIHRLWEDKASCQSNLASFSRIEDQSKQ